MANGLSLENPLNVENLGNPRSLALSSDGNMYTILTGLNQGLVIPKKVEIGIPSGIATYQIEAKKSSNNVVTLQIKGTSGERSFVSFKDGQLLISGDKKQALVVLEILAKGMSEVTRQPGLDPSKPYAKAEFSIGDTGAKVLGIFERSGIKGGASVYESAITADFHFPDDSFSLYIPTDNIVVPWRTPDRITITQNGKDYGLNTTTGDLTDTSDPTRTIKLSKETKIEVLQGKNRQIGVLINNQPIEQAFNKTRAGNEKPTEPLF